jgi:hypothetical protein
VAVATTVPEPASNCIPGAVEQVVVAVPPILRVTVANQFWNCGAPCLPWEVTVSERSGTVGSIQADSPSVSQVPGAETVVQAGSATVIAAGRIVRAWTALVPAAHDGAPAPTQ